MFGLSDQVRPKSVCSVIETRETIDLSHVASSPIILPQREKANKLVSVIVYRMQLSQIFSSRNHYMT